MENVCTYCEREFNVAQYGTNQPLAQTRDHVIPISKGGKKGDINMVACCRECNSFKGDLLLNEFAKKAKDYFDNNKRYKTIPHTRLFLVYKNAEALNETFVKVRGAKLYTNDPAKILSTSDLIADGEFKVVIKNDKTHVKTIPRRLKNLCADVRFSVTNNTSSRQSIERIEYLQTQTPEQFLRDKRIKELLSAPAENFHYAD